MTAVALETALENAFVARITDYLTAGGAHLDPDLPSGCQLKAVGRGEELLESDYSAGPVVRVFVQNSANTQDLLGAGQSTRVYELTYTFQVIGISAPNSDRMQALDDAALIAQVLEVAALPQPLDTISTGVTGGKVFQPIVIRHLGTSRNTTTSGTNTPSYKGVFTQRWTLLGRVKTG